MSDSSGEGAAGVSLPPLYAAWLEQALDGQPLPPERKATCASCVMCNVAPARTNLNIFNPRTKCCTYTPDLHNFLVGRILLEPNPEFVPGRAIVEERLDRRAAVSPFGLYSTAEYITQYRSNPEAFGHDLKLRCPYYIEDGGRCGVWRHRNATCATWFCKHERGETGRAFWKTVEQLLLTVEEDLARWCVWQLDPGHEALKLLFPLAQNSGPDTNRETVIRLNEDAAQPVYRRLWGRWYGREREFYIECARLVEGLDWDGVLKICGPKTTVYRQLLLEARAVIAQTELPDRLRTGHYEVIEQDEKTVLVKAYSAFDPLQLPARLLNLLPYFDGRPVAEVLQIILTVEGVRLSPALLGKLCDFGMLEGTGPELA